MPKIGSRTIDPPEFAAGKRRQVLLPKENLVHAYGLRLNGTFNVVGGTGAGTPYSDAALRLAGRRVIVKADGRELISARPSALGIVREFLYPKADYQDPPSNDTAGLSEAIEGNVYIPTHIPRSSNEYACLFPSYAADSPVLIVDCAEAADAISGEDGAISLADAEYTLKEYPVDGLLLSPAKQLYGAAMILDMEVAVEAAAAARKIYLDICEPGVEIGRILVEAEDNDATDDALIEQFRLNVNGIDVIETTTWDEQRNRNYVQYNLAARKAGAIMLDAAEDTRTGLGDLWTVYEGPRPFLEVKLAAPTANAKLYITVLMVKRLAVATA